MTEYIQPIGVVYYWMLRVCILAAWNSVYGILGDAGNAASCGSGVDPFMRDMAFSLLCWVAIQASCPSSPLQCACNAHRVAPPVVEAQSCWDAL